MEADGAPSTPLLPSVLRFTGIQSYSYTDQRKVEADVKVTEDRTGDLSLRKPLAILATTAPHLTSFDCFVKSRCVGIGVK